jgi:CRISPR-associated protein Cas5t
METHAGVSLEVSTPVCSFRHGRAREYLKTEILPPPSTLYGFLLSLVGETQRETYLQTRLAYALVKQPEKSVVLRSVWRVKEKNENKLLGIGKNRRPDYQEILTSLILLVFVDKGPLAQKLTVARYKPEKISRFGGLSLGESRDLINDITWSPELSSRTGQWLTPDGQGELALPLWVDHVGSKDTVYQQFALREGPLEKPGKDSGLWITISR